MLACTEPDTKVRAKSDSRKAVADLTRLGLDSSRDQRNLGTTMWVWASRSRWFYYQMGQTYNFCHRPTNVDSTQLFILNYVNLWDKQNRHCNVCEYDLLYIINI